MGPRLIVTRPSAQADEWVQQLGALGLCAQALPLIGIGALADPAPLRTAWQSLGACALVVFVSPNAVQHFFAARPAPGPHEPPAGWPPGVLAGATGPGTSAALRRAGVPAAQLAEPAAQAAVFDSEALWASLQGRPWAGRRVLVVRGEDGRDWLADELRGRGAEVAFVAAYRRLPPVLDAAAQALLAAALATPAAHVWLFSSSQAVGHLRTLAPAADWATSRALAAHPRIAQAARDAGFGRVEATAPSPQAVAAWVATAAMAATAMAQATPAPSPSIQSAPL